MSNYRYDGITARGREFYSIKNAELLDLPEVERNELASAALFIISVKIGVGRGADSLLVIVSSMDRGEIQEASRRIDNLDPVIKDAIPKKILDFVSGSVRL